MTLEELKQKSLTELKAIAYDLLIEQQNVNNSLQIVYQQIDVKEKEVSVEDKIN